MKTPIICPVIMALTNFKKDADFGGAGGMTTMLFSLYIEKVGEGMPGDGIPGEGIPGEGIPGEGRPGDGSPEKNTLGESGTELFLLFS
jgi:hypothetical protein